MGHQRVRARDKERSEPEDGIVSLTRITDTTPVLPYVPSIPSLWIHPPNLLRQLIDGTYNKTEERVGVRLCKNVIRDDKDVFGTLYQSIERF